MEDVPLLPGCWPCFRSSRSFFRVALVLQRVALRLGVRGSVEGIDRLVQEPLRRAVRLGIVRELRGARRGGCQHRQNGGRARGREAGAGQAAAACAASIGTMSQNGADGHGGDDGPDICGRAGRAAAPAVCVTRADAARRRGSSEAGRGAYRAGAASPTSNGAQGAEKAGGA